MKSPKHNKKTHLLGVSILVQDYFFFLLKKPQLLSKQILEAWAQSSSQFKGRVTMSYSSYNGALTKIKVFTIITLMK